MKLFVIPFLFFALYSCGQSIEKKVDAPKVLHTDSLQTAYFAAGCFWCVEAIFESIDGVEEVYSGYSGGIEKNPTYETVTGGNSTALSPCLSPLMIHNLYKKTSTY